MPEEVFSALEEMVVAPTSPDLTFILDLPAELGLGRAHDRRRGARADRDEPDAYEKRDLAFHWKLRAAFAEIAKSDPERCVLIDAGAESSVVSDAIWGAVEARLLSEQD